MPALIQPMIPLFNIPPSQALTSFQGVPLDRERDRERERKRKREQERKHERECLRRQRLKD